jgi:hypothetical protein
VQIPKEETLLQVVKWGLSQGHTAEEMSEGLQIPIKAIWRAQMVLKGKVQPQPVPAKDSAFERWASKEKRKLHGRQDEDETPADYGSPQYRNWLRAKEGAAQRLAELSNPH